MEKNRKTQRKPLELGLESNTGHCGGRQAPSPLHYSHSRSLFPNPFIYQCYDLFGTIICQFSKNENQSYDNSQLESRWTSA